jgi:biotin carboxylase
MKTLLVLGGGVDQIPGFLKAKEMCIYTIALDGNKECAGKKFADEFYQVSIKHFEQIEAFLKNYTKRQIDGVIAFGVDIPLIIAKTANLLDVNYTISEQSATLSENKLLSKELLDLLHINIPPYKKIKQSSEIDNFLEAYKFPIILKPVDNSAARGISFINDYTQLQFAYQEAFANTKEDYILLEKFLDGPQISSESLIINGKIHNIGFSDRNYDDMEKFLPNIIENGGDLPSLFMQEKHYTTLLDYLEKISKTLNIQNGVIKGDLVIYNDELYIIEFALRLSGGNFSTVEIPYNTGIDFIKQAIRLHLNLPIDEKELIPTKNDFISLRYKFAEDIMSGKIQSIQKPHLDSNIILENFHAKVGDIISSKTKNHANRLGFAITKGFSRDEAIQNAQDYLDNVEILVE